MNVMPEQAPSPQLIRNAAALATEATGEQSVVDVFHVIKNRIKHGGYGSSYDELWTRGMHGGPIQFEGVTGKRSGSAFLNIKTLDDASRWSGAGSNTLKSYIKALTDPVMQQKAAKHVGGALEFRGSPQNHMKLPNTAWRGGQNDNQFLIGPDDPQLPKPSVKDINLIKGNSMDNFKVPTVTKTEQNWNPLKIFGNQSSQSPSNGLQIAQVSLDDQFNAIGNRQRKLSGELEKAGYDQTQFKKDDQIFKNIKNQWAPILKLIPALNEQSLIPNWSDKDKYGNKPNPKPIKGEDHMPLPGPFKV